MQKSFWWRNPQNDRRPLSHCSSEISGKPHATAPSGGLSMSVLINSRAGRWLSGAHSIVTTDGAPGQLGSVFKKEAKQQAESRRATTRTGVWNRKAAWHACVHVCVHACMRTPATRWEPQVSYVMGIPQAFGAAGKTNWCCKNIHLMWKWCPKYKEDWWRRIHPRGMRSISDTRK